MSTSAITTLIAVAKTYSIYSSSIILTIGVLGNIFNFIIFNSEKIFHRNTISFYLKVESIVNIFNLILSTSQIILLNIESSPLSHSLVGCKIQSMLVQILIPISLSIICLTTIDEFLCTSYIVHLRQISSHSLARYSLVTIGIVWTLHTIPIGIFTVNYPAFGCFPSNRSYIYYYLYFYYPILLGFLPILIASIFSLLAFRNVRRIVRRQVPIVRRRLDQQMTALVFTRVITLAILYAPYLIFYIYAFTVLSSFNYFQYAILQLAGSVIYSFVNLNNAIMFYVFFISNGRFRRQMKVVFIKRWQRYWKQTRQNQIEPLQDMNSVSEKE